jgi:hypothetical protein
MGVSGRRGHTTWPHGERSKTHPPQPNMHLLTSWLLPLPKRGMKESGKILEWGRGGGGDDREHGIRAAGLGGQDF